MRRLGFLAAATAFAAAAAGWVLHRHTDLRASEERTRQSFREAYSHAADTSSQESVDSGIRLQYFDAPWDRVLRDVAEQSGLVLVMDRVPRGRFARRDRAQHTPESAIRILNSELEPLGYRLVPQAGFLVVLHLDQARTRYSRPMLSQERPNTTFASGRSDQSAVGSQVTQVSGGGRTARREGDRWPVREGEAASAAGELSAERSVMQTTTLTRQARGYDEDARPGSSASEASPADAAPADLGPSTIRTVNILNQRAADLARSIYLVFEKRAELIPEGLESLPSFDVFPPGERTEETKRLFRIGIDQDGNRLLVEAPKTRADSISNLIANMDKPATDESETVRLVPSEKIAPETAEELTQSLNRMVALQQQSGDQSGANAAGAGGTGIQPAGDESYNVRNNVDIQSWPDLGILLMTGNDEDLQKVLRIIQQLDSMSEGSLPNVELVEIEHVNSEALSELLTSVYERLAELRQRGNNTRQTIAFFPVVQPNAILVLAPEFEVENIRALIGQLDAPLDPASEFKVFPLKNAIASQVITALESFYSDRGGLGTNVRSIADVRTNTVIVQGRPRDLLEVEKLISSIDADTPASTQQVRVIQLRHATAEALAEVISQAIQSVTAPPTQTGAGGGFGGGFGGQQGAQELRDSRSVALEFLTSADGVERLIKSGILVDVRVTADVRTNSLIVSAPDATMSLMEALIRELDRSPAATAEIKVFTLRNADATQSVDLLTTLFDNQNNEDQLGVQIAGAEDSASSLIPVQFSADVRTNSVLAVGSAESLSIVEAILLRLDNDESRQRKTEVIQLKNAPADVVADAITRFLEQQQALQDSTDDLLSNIERLRQEVLVADDLNSNSLIVSASPEYFGQIQAIIDQLDATPPEVVIQALLVEVQLDNTDEFGVELGFQDPLLFQRSIIADAADLITIPTVTNVPGVGQVQSTQIITQNATPGFNFNNTGSPLGNNAAGSPSALGTQGIANFSLGRQNGDLGFGGFVFSAQSDAVSVLIRALAARRTVHVLSRPMIRTTHNNEAQIQVGQEAQVATGVTITNNIVQPTFATQAVGIILRVTPRITSDGVIAMDVYAEKSNLTPSGIPVFTDITTGNTVDSFIKELSAADTSVNVPNGQTIVIGGMITKSDETLERKVPWLGDLPIVGKAFRYDSTNTVRTELLIFLTPRIIYGDVDSELIKQIEAERMHFLESEAEEIHGPLYSVPPSEPAYGEPVYGDPAFDGAYPQNNFVPGDGAEWPTSDGQPATRNQSASRGQAAESEVRRESARFSPDRQATQVSGQRQPEDRMQIRPATRTRVLPDDEAASGQVSADTADETRQATWSDRLFRRN